MSDDIEDQNKKANALKETFAKAMAKEVPVLGMVISMEAFLMRRFAKQNEKAKEYHELAKTVNAEHKSELENDPFAAPVLRLAREEAARANLTRQHILFIQQREAELSQPVMNTVINVRPSMGWGIPSLTPHPKQ